MVEDNEAAAGRNPENIEFCAEQGRKAARSSILRYWSEYSSKLNGGGEWLAASNYALQYAVEKMAADGMTAAGLRAWLDGFHAEVQPFIAKIFKPS